MLHGSRVLPLRVSSERPLCFLSYREAALSYRQTALSYREADPQLRQVHWR